MKNLLIELTLVLQIPSEKVQTDPKKQLQIQSQKVFGAVGIEFTKLWLS